MIALAFALAAQDVIGPAGPLDQPRAATGWSCTLAGADGKPWTVRGRFDEVPKGADPNRSLPTRVEGETPAWLVGEPRFTAGRQSDFFRSYQVSIRGSRPDERYHLNLELRRGGSGIANVTHYAPREPFEPFGYVAAGLCTSEFEAVKGAG